METLYPFPFVHKHELSKNGKLKYPCCVCTKMDPEEDSMFVQLKKKVVKNFVFALNVLNMQKKKKC